MRDIGTLLLVRYLAARAEIEHALLGESRCRFHTSSLAFILSQLMLSLKSLQIQFQFVFR